LDVLRIVREKETMEQNQAFDKAMNDMNKRIEGMYNT